MKCLTEEQSQPFGADSSLILAADVSAHSPVQCDAKETPPS